MADKKSIVKLDQRLSEDGIIDSSFEKEYEKVHKFLNAHVRKTGKILSDETFRIGDGALREWLVTLHRQGASQEKLTSYLRIGLAHLSFDFIESQFESIPQDDLIARVLVSLKKRKFHKSFFRSPEEFRKSVAPAKKKAVAVKKSAKKLPAKSKKTVKKVAKKKAVTVAKKKAVGKKKVSKKAVTKQAEPEKRGILSRVFGKKN